MDERAIAIVAVALAVSGLTLFLLRPRLRIRGEGRPVDRRRFLNHVLLGSLGMFAAAFGGGSVALLWPQPRSGFGARIVVGKLDRIKRQVEQDGPLYHPEGRFYLVAYQAGEDNRYVRAGVAAAGLMALSQKCSHLGCRVPYCQRSGWFECPCHGARFNGAGEVKKGPAPAGMWRYRMEITEYGDVVVDTSDRVAQPPAGVDTTGQQPAGEFCVAD